MTTVAELSLTSRSRTRPRRLRLLDRWVAQHETLPADALFVDVGVGHEPWTTLEVTECFGHVRVIGVDTDAACIEAARRRARPPKLVFCAPGGIRAGSAQLVRVMNVLRGAPHGDLHAALVAWGSWLEPDGGVLYEGTASATGDVLVASRFVREGRRLRRAGLLFATDFSRGFHPHQLRDRLPRELRGRREARPLDVFFSAWRQ
ncbi:MAG: class I SAM-dependent methyltransferase, partial [Myxococcota bacterium]